MPPGPQAFEEADLRFHHRDFSGRHLDERPAPVFEAARGIAAEQGGHHAGMRIDSHAERAVAAYAFGQPGRKNRSWRYLAGHFHDL
jgi:hypothetical protein